jgi:hypothetical protein
MRSWLEIWLPNCEAQQALQMWSRELEWLLAAGGQAGETIVGHYGRVSCVLAWFFMRCWCCVVGGMENISFAGRCW